MKSFESFNPPGCVVYLGGCDKGSPGGFFIWECSAIAEHFYLVEC